MSYVTKFFHATQRNKFQKLFFFFYIFPGLSFAVTVAIVEFCWKTSVAFNSDPQKEINFRQTSPVLQRRNFRRFTSVDRRRSRKSLCAEIGNNDDDKCLKKIWTVHYFESMIKGSCMKIWPCCNLDIHSVGYRIYILDIGIVIFYTKILTGKVVLWCFFTSTLL